MARILIIDDDKDFVDSTAELLDAIMTKAFIESASSGMDGLKAAQTNPPDTILLDLSMPTMDGYEVATRLKKNEKTSNIPIIMLTGVGTRTSNKIKALECGADAFLNKPCDPGELAAQINAMLRIRKAEEMRYLENMRLKNLNEQLEHEVNAKREFERALRKHREELETIVHDRTAQLHLLHEINNAVNIGKPLEEVLQITTDGVRKMYDYAVCDTYSYNEETNEVALLAISIDSNVLEWIKKTTGISAHGMKIVVEKDSLFDQVIQSRQTIIEPNMRKVLSEFTPNKAIKALAGKVATFLGYAAAMRAPIIAGGKVIGIIGMGRKTQITEDDRNVLSRFAAQISGAFWRAQTEGELKREYAFRKAIENSVMSGITAVDLKGRIIFANPAFCSLVGYNREELIGKGPPFPYWPTEGQDTINKFLLDSIKGVHMPDMHEIKFTRKDGKTVDVILNASGLKDNNGKTIGMLASFQDITERKSLERQVLEASEEERQRIGRELHDSVGQFLTGTAFMAKALEDKLKKQTIAESSDISMIVKNINTAIDMVRRMAKGVSSIQIDTDKCCSIFQELSSYASDTLGIKCEFSCDEDISIDDPGALGQMYMIAREAILNAAKHCGSDSIRLTITADNDNILLAVEDDGCGFNCDSPDHNGLGLDIMRYRAGVIGASLSIGAGDKGGTRLLCTHTRGKKING